MTRTGTSVERSGPLAPVADSFAGQLAALGYVSSGLAGQLALFAHLDRWLGAAGGGIADVTGEVVDQLLQARAADGYATKLTRHGLRPLLAHLEHLGLLPRPVSPSSDVDRIVSQFRRHLAEERGLNDATARNYLRVARQFLTTCPEPVDASLAVLGVREVTGFILARNGQLGVCGMQTVVGGMRALLRFLYAAGLTERALASAVPTRARRRQDLPRALPNEHVAELPPGCDPTTDGGVRGFPTLPTRRRPGTPANEARPPQPPHFAARAA